jgi:hypothetical protein
LICRLLFDYTVLESDADLAEGIVLVKALFARHHEDAGTLYSLPPLMGL